MTLPTVYRTFQLLGLSLFAIILLASCEKTGAIGDQLEKALNQNPAESSDILQPDPDKLLADEPDIVIPPPPEPVKMEPVVNKEARVSILGYHDFTEGRSNNDMIINIDDFRDQMQAIRDAGLPVISMSQFLAWKRGEADVPEKCVMITIDDGWKATHTLAMPVLREFEFPFTVFLYKNYIGVGGRSLSHDQIRELMANGADVGSHSVSHRNMASRSGRSASAQTEWLRVELEDSWNFLSETFGADGQVLKTFAYPFGIYSDEVIALAEEFGYHACFTVNGKKTRWEDHPAKLGRYVVHGRTLANFDLALDFGDGGSSHSSRKLLAASTDDGGSEKAPLVTTWPSDGQVIIDRRPEIQMSIGDLEGFDPESITMRVTGFGKVSHTWDESTRTIRFQLPQRLRTESCGVRVSFKHAGNRDWETIAWNFHLDRLASYLPPEALERLRERRSEETGDGAPASPTEEVGAETAALTR